MDYTAARVAVLVLLLPHPVSSARRPNFLLHFVDDLGYGDLGVTGHPTTHTPHIDELALKGRRLTNFYSGYPVCTASRTALLTAQLAAQLAAALGSVPSSSSGAPERADLSISASQPAALPAAQPAFRNAFFSYRHVFAFSCSWLLQCACVCSRQRTGIPAERLVA